MAGYLLYYTDDILFLLIFSNCCFSYRDSFNLTYIWKTISLGYAISAETLCDSLYLVLWLDHPFTRIAVKASVEFLATTMVRGLVILNYPATSEPQQWHGMLIYWAIAARPLSYQHFGDSNLPLF
ncbi:hypothetical protein F5B18DRAFT_351260 [Nemania serpens]|nr:hypothetical protein F5B18DRAFT_351260 [Nemania serpens]